MRSVKAIFSKDHDMHKLQLTVFRKTGLEALTARWK